MINKKYLQLLLFTFLVSSCNKKHSINEFNFLVGKWQSLGSDAFETWEKKGDSIESTTYVFKKDSLVFLDNSVIYEKDNKLYLISHLNKESTNKYEYKWINTEHKNVFINENISPNIIYYEARENGKNIYAYVKVKEKQLQFLYETIDSIPKLKKLH